MNITRQLKIIEKQKKQLQQQEKLLREQAKMEKAREQKLEQLVKESGFANPKELVLALIDKYKVSLRGRRKDSGKAGASGRVAESGQRRTRTRVTPELRDEIKKEHKAGATMNAISKARKISYVVISKICKGEYDAL